MTRTTLAFCAQLFLLLGVIIAITTGQSCDDIICCSGRVCVEETTRNGLRNRTRCVTPTSCDQLDCPAGLVCVEETRGTKLTRTKARCRVSCDNVDCPDFLQCKVRGSRAECVAPRNCTEVTCSSGTSCLTQYRGTRQSAVCIGEDSCSSVTCDDGSECFNATSTSNRPGTKVEIRVQIDSDSTPVPLKRLLNSNGQTRSKTGKTRSKTGKTRSKTFRTRGSATTGGQQAQNVSVCLPTCEEASVCPQGLVCEERGYELTCREPRSCDELVCPEGQECEEIMCGINNTRTRSSILVRCVDVGSASGSGAAVITGGGAPA